MQPIVKPTPIALVVCDTIYREPSGKLALVGLFNGIVSPRFPARHPSLSVFASVTGVRSGSQARIEIVHAETDKQVIAAQGPFPPDAEPLAIVDLTFAFNHLVFPDPGKYYIRFWGNDHLLLMRPFDVASTNPAE